MKRASSSGDRSSLWIWRQRWEMGSHVIGRRLLSIRQINSLLFAFYLGWNRCLYIQQLLACSFLGGNNVSNVTSLYLFTFAQFFERVEFSASPFVQCHFAPVDLLTLGHSLIIMILSDFVWGANGNLINGLELWHLLWLWFPWSPLTHREFASTFNANHLRQKSWNFQVLRFWESLWEGLNACLGDKKVHEKPYAHSLGPDLFE